jgi:DUF4097 and DUF4098 domain-containing protein YvlB
MIRKRALGATLLTALAIATVLTLPAGSVVQAAGTEQDHSFSADRLTVRNVIGEIRIEGHGGSTFEVVVRSGGRDSADGAIRTKISDDQLDVVFPAGKGDFVYPRLGRSKSDFSLKNSGDMADLFYGGNGIDRIKVRGSGTGLELWADVTVLVPPGGRLEIVHGVGEMFAENVDGDLEMATRAGDVTADRTHGELAVATGSGDVGLSQIDSEDIEIATGSGNIKIRNSRGEEVELASGSGEIFLSGVQANSIEVGTGSGDITAEEIDALEVEMGTGSGDVTLDLWKMGRGKYEIGTGSGDIELTVAGGVSAEVHAETSGGNIVVDLDAAEFSKRAEDEVRLTVGGGDARVELGTGNGDIRIRG